MRTVRRYTNFYTKRKGASQTMWLWILIIVGSIWLDQLTKWLAVTLLQRKKQSENT